MSSASISAIVPRNGRRLRVIGICRISTDSQDERSLADQEALLRKWLDDQLGVPYDLQVIASRDSGEAIDRHEYLQAIQLVESRQFDVVITEDLGRIVRRVHAQLFCEACEDAESSSSTTARSS